MGVKKLRFHRLVTEGEFAGKYVPIMFNAHGVNHALRSMLLEVRAIEDAGGEIVYFDPKGSPGA